MKMVSDVSPLMKMRLSVTLTYKHKDHGQDKWIELAI